jgi:formylglycine-generating enzyme required for sulfatase activity
MKNIISLLLFIFIITSCKNKIDESKEIPKTPDGMVWVPSKTFSQGAKANDKYAMPREKPAHPVKVDGFFIDKTEVTNAQFKKFVEETGYTTVAERPVEWEELKKELPPNTPKPADSILLPGSLIFNKNAGNVKNMNNYMQWWIWQNNADWQHPDGPNSNIEGKENHPVVHIAFEDAIAYCDWANRRLPTEAEWEAAAQGKQDDMIYTWGNDASVLNENANTWQGEFPSKNLIKDGYFSLAPVKSYPPNSIGIYDMMGNVWELTSDLFNVKYYESIETSKVLLNPKGADIHFNPTNPFEVQHVIKGGSFLCHESYCASFRISARMGAGLTSSTDHMGFRTVATPKMLSNNP